MSPTSMMTAAARSRYIGGSDVAAILGISPWATPVELWLQKREATERFDDPILKRGRRLEPYIRDMYAEDTGRTVSPPAFCIGAEPWIAANTDGETTDRVLEIKTAHPRTRAAWGDAGTDSIPVYYTAQVQWYMMVCKKPRADLAALIGIDDFRIFTIEAEPKIQARMLEAARLFWQMVKTGTPPPITSEDDARALFPVSLEQSIEATPDITADYMALRETNAAIEREEEHRNSIRARLMAHMGAADTLTNSGRTLATWKRQSSNRIDVATLRHAHPDIAEALTVTTESRVFRLR